MRSLLFALLLFQSLASFAQSEACEKTIEGQVLDAHTKDPLPFATVNIIHESLGVVTDIEGKFTFLNICESEVEIEVRFIGYKTLVHHHDFHHAAPVIYLAPEETLLESVVVEEALNAHDLKTLDSKDLQYKTVDRIGMQAGNLLSKMTGVTTLKSGQNVIKPIIHGLHSNRVLIINNGVRHSYQAWGNDHGVEIDAAQIDRIRLIKGASTVRYGANALGGVILFDAKRPEYSTPLSGNVGSGFQSNGRSLSGEASLNKGFERLALNVSISGTKQGDLRAADYQLTNTGKEEFGLTLGGRVHFPVVDIDLFVSHFAQKLGILKGSVNGNLEDFSHAIVAEVPNETKPFSYDINNPHQETVHDLVKLSSSIFILEQQFDVQYAFQRNVRKEFDVRRGTNNALPSIDLQLNSHSLDIDWDHQTSGSWAGTYGIQYFSQDNNNLPGTNTIPFVPNFNTYSLGFFGIESYKSNDMTYEAGVRLDLSQIDVRGRDTYQNIYRDNIKYENATFTLGFVKQFSDQVSLRSNVGTAWRAPNVNELYSFGKHQSIIEFGLWRYETFAENDSISTRGVLSSDQKEVKSERGLKWISTLHVAKDKFQFEATPYVNWIKNYFFMRPYGITTNVRGVFPYFIHDQTDALYTGMDVSLRYSSSYDLKSELKVSYVHARDTKNNQPFVGIPPLNIQMKLKKKIKNFSIEFEPEWTSRQVNEPMVIDAEVFIESSDFQLDRSNTFDFLAAPDAYFLLNIALGYENSHMAIKLKGSNLLNVSYRSYTDNMRYFADDMGLNIGLFASYSF